MSTEHDAQQSQTEPSSAAIAASPEQSRLHRFLLIVFLLAVSVAASASFLHSYQAEAGKEAALRAPAGIGAKSCGEPSQGCGASRHPGAANGAGKSCGAGPQAIGATAREWSMDYGPTTAPTTLAYLVDPTQATDEDRSVAENLSRLAEGYAGRLRVVIRPYGHPDARAYGGEHPAVLISERDSARKPGTLNSDAAPALGRDDSSCAAAAPRSCSAREEMKPGDRTRHGEARSVNGTDPVRPTAEASGYRVLFDTSAGSGGWTAEQLRDKVRAAIGPPPTPSGSARTGAGA
ncbi:MAG TPA: hypothetical protein PLD23_16895 [Armatimonadota bacterium]|mgnify:CR=1 FL=1|nr:hypothetical protein [Armatimonadota bacterium]